jgi:hypothetical protein
MKKLMSSSMFGLVPVPLLADTSRDDLRAAREEVEVSHPVLPRPTTERMATKEDLARIRDELKACGVESTKHAHWRSVLLRATWRRVH